LQDKRKDAVKKVIAAMTVGKDVSSLFTDVVNCMQTENLELKKLVYLYLINYAKSQPDLAILAVNTFVKVKSGMTIILFVCVGLVSYCTLLNMYSRFPLCLLLLIFDNINLYFNLL
jgi:AP-1 complex subunit beta-1